MAVRDGGGVANPDENFHLRLAVDRARQSNMPKENIQRAIDRGGGLGGGELSEIVFEGFLPGGAAVLASALTDNKLRTAQEVREVLDKNGGTLAGQGAVSYMFTQAGELRVKNTKLTDDDELKMIDAGINEVETGEDEWVIYCERDKTYQVKENLEKMGYTVAGAELVMKPVALVPVGPEDSRKAMGILEKLADLEDVHKVYTNADFS